MKYWIKFSISFVVCFFIAIAIWRPMVTGLLAFAFLLAWAIVKTRHKVLPCFLAACLAASPAVFAGDNYAGYDGNQCYCFTPAAEDPNPPEQTAFSLDFILEPNEAGEIQPRITGMRHPAPSDLVSYEELNQSLAAWGINLDGGMQFSKNGQPATADEMPFAFGDWSNPLTIYPDREQYRVLVEVASELGAEFTFWQPVAHFSVPAGVRIHFQDSPEGSQTFYRVRLERPPEDFQAAGPLLLGCGVGLLFGTAVVGVLAVRACARNKKKFEKLLPPTDTNAAAADLIQ